MLFTQVEFVVLLLAVLAALTAITEPRRQKLVLLAASNYFYAYWDWRFLSLVWLSTLVDFTVGRAMARTEDRRRRKRLLQVSLVVNLGLLGVFKYFDFFVDSLAPLVAALGWEVGSLDVILPIGISFYTFQTLSYTIDLYRRKIPPCKSLLDFAVFVSFFPQLVAGPIVRAADFLPQLQRPITRTASDLFCGGRTFVIGLFKKVFIADNLARFVDEVFANAGAYDSLTTWLGVIAYAIQIYCDFSGYSDMAIGTARMLGFRFPQNFRFPYLARSMSDFWRRWHISLSSWLRDYLYISLGGNRHGSARTLANLMITMLLGGLWHGAAWTFVAWGGFHGLALVGQRLVSGSLLGRALDRLDPRLRAVVTWTTTLFTVLVGWVFFRAATFADAARILRQMLVPHDGLAWPFPFAIGILVAVAAAHLLQALGRGRLLALPGDRWLTPAALFFLLGLILLYHPRAFNPFIYFQF